MALYGIKDCANLTLKDKATGKPDMFSDYANVSTNEWSSERTYANSKGTRSIAWDHDRQGTLAVEMEIFDLKWLALVAGSDIIVGEADIAKREVVRVGSSKTATLTASPKAGSVSVVKVAKDEVEHVGEPLEEVTVDGTNVTEVGAGQFSVSGSEITFASDAVEGEAYAVYYVVVDAQARTIEIRADKFPKSYEIIADALIREKETGRDEFVQIHYPNARPQSNFTVTMSATDPTNLQVTFDLFPDKDKNLATYKIIGD